MSEKRGIRRLLKAFTMRFTRQSSGSWWGVWARGQYARDVGSGSDSSVVMAPLQWIMRTFPEAPCVVDRLINGSWEVEFDHDLASLLDRPNPYYSGDLMWRATVAQLALDGNAYWVKVTDQQLRVTELWWVPSSLIEPRWPTDGTEFISHYEYKPGGEPVRLETTEVVHFRWDLDPTNDRKGLSPLAAVLREVFADDEAGRFAAALLKNMGVPGLIIAPDGDFAVGDEDMSAAKAKLKATFGGDNRGEPFVAGAPTKVTQFGFSPQQMDMRTLRRVPEERVTAALGVPAIVAGLGAGLDRSTFANFAEAREMGYESCIIPLQKMIAAELKAQLLGDFEANPRVVRVRFDLTEVRVLQEDQNKMVERKLKELQAGAIPLSQYLRETGREAGPEHEVYLRGFNVVEVPVAELGQPTPPPEPPVIDADPLLQIEPPDAEDDEDEAAKRKRRRKASERQLQQRLIREFQRQHNLLSDVVTPRLQTVFEELGVLAADRFEAQFSAEKAAGDKDPANANEAALVTRILESMQEELLRTDAKFRRLIQQHYGNTTAQTVDTVNEVFGLSINLPDHVARNIVAQGGRRAGLHDISSATREALFRSLVDGRVLGEGPEALARRIRDQVPAGRFSSAGSNYRAKLIARTETKFAQNVSAMSAYSEAGATALLAFDAQGAGDSDPECEARNGQTFSFDEAQVALDEEHPNGTLSFAPVFGG